MCLLRAFGCPLIKMHSTMDLCSGGRSALIRNGGTARSGVCAIKHQASPIPRLRTSATTLDKPAWTGDSPLSWFVNLLINTPATYNVMKFFAKQAIKNGAIDKGVDWNGHVAELTASQSELLRIQEELTNKSIQYPDYYLQPFHSYEEGNLCWEAAYEVDPATYAMALRTFKTETMSPQAAFDKLRGGYTDILKVYLASHQLQEPQVIVDVGCATGLSTGWLASEFPEADVTGLDLSPYFLAVAERRERRKPEGVKRIRYIHGLAEATGMPDSSVDLLAYQFIIHECPDKIIESFCREARRILKPGGVIMMIDNDPKSATIQNLPPVLFTLMKSTEPHSDNYYSTDVQAIMKSAGFTSVSYKQCDHRHQVLLGVAP